MSVNPVIALVVGIDDPVPGDPRRKVVIEYDAWIPPLIRCDDFGEFELFGGAYAYDVVWSGSPLGCSTIREPKGVLGYIPERLDSYDDMTRCLAAVLNKLTRSEDIIMPWPDEKRPERLEERGGDHQVQIYRLARDEGRLFRYMGGTTGWMTSEKWYTIAMHVFRYIGWTGVERSMLKTMFVYDWV